MIRYLLLDLYKRTKEDGMDTYAAQITYFLILSLFPFLIFLITLISRTFIFKANYFNLLDQLQELGNIIPMDIITILKQALAEINSNTSDKFLSLSVVITIYSASRGVRAVMKGMNKAFKTKETRGFFRILVISFLYTIALALLLLAGFAIIILGGQIGYQLFTWLGLEEIYNVWSFLISYVIPFIIMTIVYTFIYRYTPNIKLSFREVLPGSAFATLFSVIASVLFSFYVTNFANYSVVYGSIGSIVIMLLWLYILSMVLILGGEINAALYDYHKLYPSGHLKKQ